MTSAIDNLARPANPDASRHVVAPSPKFCLRQGPSGFWYLIPFIYEYGFDAWCDQWKKDHIKEEQAVFSGQMAKWTRHLASTYDVPAYAKQVDVKQLVFEKPEALPYDHRINR